MPERTEYLRLQARLRADNVITNLRTEVRHDARLSSPSDLHGAVAWVDIVGEDGARLLRWAVSASVECTLLADGGRSGDTLLRAFVPLPLAARALRIVRDDVVLTTLRVAAHPPEADVQWHLEQGQRMSGRHAIAWRSNNDSARAVLKYSTDDGHSWMRIASRAQPGDFAIDFDELPGSPRCLLALVVTADCRSTTVTSAPFQVAEKAPAVAVVSPPDGAVLRGGETAFFAASVAQLLGSHNRDAVHAVTWQSDRDGEFGRGAIVWTRLSEGPHRITARVAHHSSAPVAIEVKGS